MKKRFLNFTLPERQRPARQAITRIPTEWEARKNHGIKNAAANEFLIYSEIGDSWYFDAITAKNVIAWLAERDGQDVTIRINSPGGDVFEGIAIYNALAKHNGEVTIIVDSIAASIASIILMAGDKRIIAANGTVMVHCAWTIAAGCAEDFRKEASILDGIDVNLVETYVARTGKDAATIKPLVDAETWMSAADALANGFVDEIQPAKTPEPTPEPPVPDEPSAELSKTFQALLSRFEARTKTTLQKTTQA